MKKNLRDTLFGFRKNQNAEAADAAAAALAAKKEKTLASINESDTTPVKPRIYRTVGLTEERLRARNKESWMTSTEGWSNFFGRFTTPAKR
ncbi:MAG: hypothetical protein DMD63_01620 [Gemmatimonadetes bacterium]|nr:MAG: hypothetical protein DMD63_01620 [Gemmatimonadota bacterium]